jgi:hypothetical protein
MPGFRAVMRALLFLRLSRKYGGAAFSYITDKV